MNSINMNSNRGESLIMVMIAVGLSGIMILSMMSMFTWMQKTQMHISNKYDLKTAEYEIRAILLDESACRFTFSGYIPPTYVAPPGTKTFLTLDGTSTPPFTGIKDKSNNATIYTVGPLLAFNNKFSLAYQLTQYNSSTQTMELNLQFTLAGDNFIGPNVLNRVVTLNTHLDAMGKIDNCSSYAIVDSSPRGMIAAFNGTACPAGWVEADGVNSPMSNGGTNALDLRGRFVRGMNGNGVDPDGNRILGNIQLDGVQEHVHTTPSRRADWGTVTVEWKGSEPYLFAVPQDSWPSNGVSGARIASETRPVNVAVLYCIKQ